MKARCSRSWIRSALPRHWWPRTPRRDISAPCMVAVIVDGSKSSPFRPMEAGSRGRRRAPTDATTEGGLWVAGGDGSTIPVTSSAHPPDPAGGWIWAWSPAADQLAFATGRPGLAELVLFDPATGERTSAHDGRGDLRVVVVAGRHRDRDRGRLRQVFPSSISQPGVPPRSRGSDPPRTLGCRGRPMGRGSHWQPTAASPSSARTDRAAASSSITAPAGGQRGLRTARGSPSFERRVRPTDPRSRCG